MKKRRRRPYYRGVPLDPAHCPADLEEVAEAFAMELLPEGEMEAFNEHLLICGRCRAVVERADDCVRSMKAAAAQIRREEKSN